MAEHDVFEPFEALGIELGAQTGFADELVAEHDVALENSAAAALGREGALVFDGFSRVVHEDAGHREVGVDFGIEREQGFAGARHVGRVFEQAVTIGVVHCDGGG